LWRCSDGLSRSSQVMSDGKHCALTLSTMQFGRLESRQQRIFSNCFHIG
jgi:hypothetical protein